MPTNLQRGIEGLRKKYAEWPRPMLYQLAEVHGITIREFAKIFSISKSHAELVLNHKVFPSLELAVRISRYLEMPIEDLFAWRIDDDGQRRPLLVDVPGTGKMVRLHSRNESHESLPLAQLIVDALKTGTNLLDHPRLWRKQ